jgi:hypothetical protein
MLIKSIQKFLGIEESGFFDPKTKKAWTDYCHKTPGMVFYASKVPNKDYLPKTFLDMLERLEKKGKKVVKTKTPKPTPAPEPKKEEKPQEPEVKKEEPKPAKIVVFGDVVPGDVIEENIVTDLAVSFNEETKAVNIEPLTLSKEEETEGYEPQPADMVSDEIVEVKVEEVKELPKKRGRKKKN